MQFYWASRQHRDTVFSPASPRGIDRCMVMVASGSRGHLSACFKTEGGAPAHLFRDKPRGEQTRFTYYVVLPSIVCVVFDACSRGLLSGETPGTSWHPQPRTVGHRGAEMRPGLCRLFSVMGRGCQLRNSGHILTPKPAT